MRTTRITAIMTMVILIAGTSFAQQGPAHRAGQGKHHQEVMASLNLSEAQENQIKELHLKLQKETLPIENNLGENKAKLRTLTTAENADMKAINKLIDENSKLQASMAKLKAATHQAVRSLLTEEQRIKFDSRRDFARGDMNKQHHKRTEREMARPRGGQGL